MFIGIPKQDTDDKYYIFSIETIIENEPLLYINCVSQKIPFDSLLQNKEFVKTISHLFYENSILFKRHTDIGTINMKWTVQENNLTEVNAILKINYIRQLKNEWKFVPSSKIERCLTN